MGVTLCNQLVKQWQWSEDKITYFWIYYPETKFLNAPFQEIGKDKKFDDLWNRGHEDNDVSDDEDVDPKEARKIVKRKEVQKAQAQKVKKVMKWPNKAPLRVRVTTSQ